MVTVAQRSLAGVSHAPAYQVALAACEAGINVLPVRADGSKQPAVSSWKRYQHERPSPALVAEWFRDRNRGLALVTGHISGGLVALDFDDPATFQRWLRGMRGKEALDALYTQIASGYEERTPKNGRHLLFFCPEAFAGEHKPGNQRLALRPAPEPQRFEILVETREQGGIIIVDPSRGRVHPTGKPYVRLRGSVSAIQTITAAQRELLYASIRVLDEMPEMPQYVSPTSLQFSASPRSSNRLSDGDRPGDRFNRDPLVTWETLLIPLGWELVRVDEKGEGYWRHPGKRGQGHDVTTNADGSDRLFCFSAASGLPVERYLDKFAFYTWYYHGGDFKAAACALAERGYTPGRKANA